MTPFFLLPDADIYRSQMPPPQSRSLHLRVHFFPLHNHTVSRRQMNCQTNRHIHRRDRLPRRRTRRGIHRRETYHRKYLRKYHPYSRCCNDILYTVRHFQNHCCSFPCLRFLRTDRQPTDRPYFRRKPPCQTGHTAFFFLYHSGHYRLL